MGTNFYLLNKEKTHIGKRSASGAYCFNCMVSLCNEGEENVHGFRGDWAPTKPYASPTFSDSCPICGKKYKKEILGVSAAGVELGLTKNKNIIRKGVTSCASFTWSIKPNIMYREIEKFLDKPKKISVDEYGNKYTAKEIKEELESNPIHFYDFIGTYFS